MKHRWIGWASLGLLSAVAVYLASFLPSVDWGYYDPAVRGILTGHLPYEQPGFHNPPWFALVLLPLVVFPANISHGLLFVVNALILIYIMWHLKAPPLAAIAFLLSPTAVGALLVSNVDPIVISGILLPPTWGLFLLVAKPQIGFGLVFYHLLASWKAGRFRQVVRTFAPVTIVYVVSALLFPIWIKGMPGNTENIWNRSIFPYGLPLGILLLWISIRRRNPYLALASSPFFAPYHTFYSLIAVQIGLMHPDVEVFFRRDLLQLLLAIFFWTIMLAFRL